MGKIYLLLLWLYPREQRQQFSPEMLEVFLQACEEHRQRGFLAYARFASREFAGLLAGAPRAWPGCAKIAAVLGGVALAAMLQAICYVALVRVSRATAVTVQRSFIPRLDPPAALFFLVIVSLLYLFLFLLLSVRLLPRRR